MAYTSKLTQLTEKKNAAQLQTMSRDSIRWLEKKIAELRTTKTIAYGISREANRYVPHSILGGLYCFYYDPKGKDDLPYYDKFPLVLILEKYQNGFLGLNLHYLPPKHRMAFLGKLMNYAQNTPQNEIQRIRVTYDILNVSKALKEFRPCLKRYLTTHIQSKVLQIGPDEWDVAALLPLQQFKGARAEKVWQESLEDIKEF